MIPWVLSFLALFLGLGLSVGLLAGDAAAVRNPDGVAVIIGNRAYKYDVPEVTYAHRDAEAFRRYVVDVLGFDPENVIYKKDADKATLEGVFGNRESLTGSELWGYLHPKGHSDVVVFYSGHGIPGLDDKRGYLLPVNAHPDRAKFNGYRIDVLYENLVKLKEKKDVRSVHVFLDACFSGDSGGGMLIGSTSAIRVAPLKESEGLDKLTILTAASGKEVASWDKAAKHGLFTHHLLNALYGEGDADADGQVTAAEAKDYLDEHMTKAARKQFGRVQNSELRGVETAVLARAVGGQFPQRREVVPDRETEEAARQLAMLRTNIQDALRDVGFASGPTSGQWSEGARKALEAYQRVKGVSVTGELSEQQLVQLRRDLEIGWHNRTCRIQEKLERPESCPEKCRNIRKTRYQCDDVDDFVRLRCNANPRAFEDFYEMEEWCEKKKLTLAQIKARRQCRPKDAHPGFQEGDLPEDAFLCDCSQMGCTCRYDFTCCEEEIYYKRVCPQRCPQRAVRHEVCECKAPEFCN